MSGGLRMIQLELTGCVLAESEQGLGNPDGQTFLIKYFRLWGNVSTTIVYRPPSKFEDHFGHEH